MSHKCRSESQSRLRGKSNNNVIIIQYKLALKFYYTGLQNDTVMGKTLAFTAVYSYWNIITTVLHSPKQNGYPSSKSTILIFNKSLE